MAYDPKKKRPKTKSLDSVVDEIFGEESSAGDKKAKSASAKPAVKKAKTAASKTTKPTSKKPASSQKKTTSLTSAKSKPKPDKPGNEEKKEDARDNVVPLYPESQDTPLILQPQVWVASAIAAILLLVFIKKRK